jgi:hypothetical protein
MDFFQMADDAGRNDGGRRDVYIALSPATFGRNAIPTSRSPPKHEDHAYHSRAKAHARAEELNDVHSAIHLEALALRHPEKSDEANQQRDNPNHNRRPFAINHFCLLSGRARITSQPKAG